MSDRDDGWSQLTTVRLCCPGQPVESRVLTRPVTLGLPFAPGLLPSVNQLLLKTERGRDVPVQVGALDRWNDGSVRWALIDFQGSAAEIYALGVSHSAPRLPPSFAGILVERKEQGLFVSVGVARFRILAPPLLSFALVSGQPEQSVAEGHLEIQGASGERWMVALDAVDVESAGALRSVVVVRGSARGRRSHEMLRVTIRIHFFANLPIARFDITLHNPNRARHPGGYWELGDPGSVHLREVAFRLRPTGRSDDCELWCSPELNAPFERSQQRLELYQDSSGGPHWDSRNHVNRRGEVPLVFRGYWLRTETGERRGLRSTPLVVARTGASQIAVAVPQFWQNFPRAIEASSDSILVGLFPRQSRDTHELQAGEQKTHRFFVSFAAGGVHDHAVDWCRQPIIACAEPAWYCSAQPDVRLTPRSDVSSDAYARLVDQAITGDTSFERKREIADEYGWRHFGDIYADHEAVGHKGPAPLLSHFNNQYDAVAGFACQVFMTADHRWWLAMDELARHVVDIDIYHTDRDKSAFNRGLFWHTHHYVDAGRSTHRSYPAANGVIGGGPSPEHNYSTGLMFHYFLTGEEASRESVLELARWVIDMDDGSKTVFRWLAGGPTGLASAAGTLLYHGPGRGAANSIRTLLNAFRLTGQRLYLDKAEELVRRCIHPEDDIASLDLLDAERRWFYTVFLQALGRYLQVKAERLEWDGMYAYARASLLHYARWMAEHEYPYLDKPEILKYPTETWAAQDMRKSEVFDLACLLATGEERARFKERSDFFFRYATETLMGMTTRALTRPVVLLLANGFSHAWFHAHPDAELPAGEPRGGWGSKDGFVPQKVRAFRRAKVLAFLVAVGVVVSGVFVLSWLFGRQ
jgi:hypothetical protein